MNKQIYYNNEFTIVSICPDGDCLMRCLATFIASTGAVATDNEVINLRKRIASALEKNIIQLADALEGANIRQKMLSLQKITQPMRNRGNYTGHYAIRGFQILYPEKCLHILKPMSGNQYKNHYTMAGGNENIFVLCIGTRVDHYHYEILRPNFTTIRTESTVQKKNLLPTELKKKTESTVHRNLLPTELNKTTESTVHINLLPTQHTNSTVQNINLFIPTAQKKRKRSLNNNKKSQKHTTKNKKFKLSKCFPKTNQNGSKRQTKCYTCSAAGKHRCVCKKRQTKCYTCSAVGKHRCVCKKTKCSICSAANKYRCECSGRTTRKQKAKLSKCNTCAAAGKYRCVCKSPNTTIPSSKQKIRIVNARNAYQKENHCALVHDTKKHWIQCTFNSKIDNNDHLNDLSKQLNIAQKEYNNKITKLHQYNKQKKKTNKKTLVKEKK